MKTIIKYAFTVLTLSTFTIACNTISSDEYNNSTEDTGSISIQFLKEKTVSANKKNNENSTIVPGHQTDDGSIPIGTVTGKYKSIYTYDLSGNYYWDLGDGRIIKTVDSINDLDGDTITNCYYEVIYKGDFKGDPYLDNGWIRNNIRCRGYEYKQTRTYNYLIIHQTDLRYTPDLDPIWGTWAYLVNAVGGTGNIANPRHPVNYD